MFDHAQLLVFTCLACLTHLGSAQFTFDGPIYHEVLAGGLVDLPCYQSTQAKRLIINSFIGEAKGTHALLWVHKRFDRMVDPWTGDGRRSYLKIVIIQEDDPLVEERGLVNISTVSGVGLRIVAVNPSVAGVYACILSKQKYHEGLYLDYANATLLSIHSLRVKAGEDSNSGDGSSKKGEQIYEKETPLNEWTWFINPSNKIHEDGTIFKMDCYADIALTGLVVRRTSGNVVRVGWKFVPLENITAVDLTAESFDETEWNLVSPVEYFHQDEDEMGPLTMTTDKEGDGKSDQQLTDKNLKVEGEFEFSGFGNLHIALKEATRVRWKTRWLRLDKRLVSKGSGMWQCWLEGIDIFTQKSTKLEHMLISEVYVHVTAPETIGPLDRADTWRDITIWTLPVCILLVFLIALVAWAAAVRWSDLLYHPLEKRKKNIDKKIKSRKGIKSGLLETDPSKSIDYTDLASIYADKNAEVFKVNQEQFTKMYLMQRGVPSREEKGDLTW